MNTLAVILTSAALALAAVAPAAQAETIDFEGAALANLYDPAFGDSFSQAGFRFQPRTDFGIVGRASEFGPSAPTGNASQFYFNSNRGSLLITSDSGAVFALQGFSAAYVPQPFEIGLAFAPVLLVEGLRADGTTPTAAIALPSMGTNPQAFVALSGGLFANLVNLTSLTLRVCQAGAVLDCSASTVINNGQFAIDNVALTSAVPEPSAMCLLAIGCVALVLRSQRFTKGRV